TPGCARWSSPRSRPSHCRCSCPAAFSTTASSTRAIPGRYWGCACPPSRPHRSRAPRTSVSAECERGVDDTPATQHRPVTAVLVANRGEIARRVFATARRAGRTTAAVYSDADADAPHVHEADVAVRLPGHAPGDTYLRADLLAQAARSAGADAVHPG